MTKNLLLHPSLCRTMSDHNREQELAFDLVTERKLEMLLKENEEYNFESNDDDKLNFNNGFAGVVIDKIVGYTDIEKSRARNNENSVFRTNTMALLKQIKTLTTAGELVKVANTHKLGFDLLTEVC